MKLFKIASLGLLISILFCGSNASAIDLYGYGSYWGKQDVDGSWGAGVGLAIPLFTEHLRLDGRATFFSDSDAGSVYRDVTLIPLDLGLQVHILPYGDLDPYLLGGVSFIYVDNSSEIDLDTKTSGYIGVGLDVSLGTSLVKLFGEAIYRFTELESVLDESIDVGGFTGNVGVKIHF
ncbi:MAG: outer membrane beta-barrel protein [Desulfofustis sp.]|nr:outer membrane beta-barrel protein [Desulfofustis sp.]